MHNQLTRMELVITVFSFTLPHRKFSFVVDYRYLKSPTLKSNIASGYLTLIALYCFIRGVIFLGLDFAKFQNFSVSFTVVCNKCLKIELFMRKLRNNELGRISVSEFKNTTKTPIIVVLDNIRSLNNIGSVFRTSDAFLIEKIYLCGITAQPPHREIQKTALGATESVEWEYRESILDLVDEVKTKGTLIASVEQAEKKVWLDEFQLRQQSLYQFHFESLQIRESHILRTLIHTPVLSQVNPENHL